MKRASPDNSSSAPAPKRPLTMNEDGTPRFKGCSSIKAYEMLGKLGEGTFGEVHKARERNTGQMVALKKILMQHEKEGFPITALREIKIMKQLSHGNVLTLKEMAVEREKDPYKVGKVKLTMYMVTPYMHHDLSGLLENPSVKFTEPQIKCYMQQLLEGTKYLHANNILHRDMKAANLLIDNEGTLRIADFGLARKFDEPPPQSGAGNGIAKREYTQCVVTRWYRPPELLLGERRYTAAIDVWGIGCVFAEMYKGKPILPGSSDVDQAHRIFKLCGSPTERNMPGWDKLPGCEGVKSWGPFQRSMEHQFSDLGSAGLSLLAELLMLDPRKRINAIDALKHEYFTALPLPAKPQDIPKFEDSHELDRRRRNQQKIPPAPAGGTVGVGMHAGPEWGRGGDSGAAWGNGSHVNGGRRRDEWRGQSRGHDSRQPSVAGGSRVPPGVHLSIDHRPPWAKESSQLPISRNPPPDRKEHGLPPRPPPPDHSRERGDRDLPPGGPPMERSRSGRNGGANIDTYIPSYGSGGGRDEPPPRSRPWDRDRDDRERDNRDRRRDDRGTWDDRHYVRRRSKSPLDRDRARDRDRDPYRR